jgi:protein-disulfide isomerase
MTTACNIVRAATGHLTEYLSAAIAASLVWLLSSQAVLAASRPATPDTGSGLSPGQTVIATIGKQQVTESDILDQNSQDFDKQQDDYALKLRQVQLQRDEARYDMLQERLEKMLDNRALELEAKARGTTTDAVLADIKVPVVTDSEARDFYASRKELISQGFEQLQAKIYQYLANRHNTDATRSFYDALRAKHAISSLLAPYRVAVDATGPALGKQDAPITIVEFGDFQCPFCREAEDTLHSLVAAHPGDVRLVFRQLPLQSLHPDATTAAEAAVCANRQGKFWEMHDAMFSDQTALGVAALKETAKRLGLDTDAFSACLSDSNTLDAIAFDTKAASELAVFGTPYFFVNGRPVNGNIPKAKFESIITDELHRTAAAHVRAAG